LPTKQLGEAPYLPSTSRALEFPASAIGLHFAPGAMVYMPPIVAGYVGADHVAALVAAEIWQASETTLLIDIGTNTEVTLAVNGQFYSCSCASGPAFEGAHIHDGMRAAPGAIERVQVIDGQIHIQTIGGQSPVGICGSGILDAVAVMLETGIINPRGAFKTRSSGFVLSEQDGRQVLVTRQDVGEIQLAKSAIRTGIELLLDRAGIRAEAIERFIIAGAFGTYINVGSAVRIGMFPNLPRERFVQVGNAAGVGAWHLLVSAQLRQQADRIARDVHYLELTTHPRFQDTFVDYMALE
jgi:uncharacterized 2Fe-2S/4Fe-4S cluster protein (DUF4445 family)